MRSRMRLGAVVATLALLATACVTTSDDADSTSASGSAPPTTATSTTTSSTIPAASSTTGVTTTTNAPPGHAGACPELPEGTPWQTGSSIRAQVLQEGDTNQPRVEAVVYPHPGYEGKPWSQWGQGLVLDDGRYLSAIGDHHGEDGNSFVFEYDPAEGALTPIADVLSLVEHRDGDWGYGKIHAQMVTGACGEVLMSTYWGTRRDIRYTEGYRGDLLFAIDPDRRTIHNLGVLYEEYGVPSMAGSPDGGLLYAEAVDPIGESPGPFLVYDPAAGEIVYTDDSDAHTGFRAIAVDADGRAYYSQGGGELAVYDPATNTTSAFAAEIPGDFLRAATPPGPDGIVYGVSRDPEVFFALDPAGSVRTLSPARAYTTSLALSPDGARIYSVPDAHGGAWRAGAPLVAVDTDTGEQQVIVELADLAQAGLDLRLGGTYNVAVDRSGKTIYIGMNAGPVDEPEEGFGEVVLLIVTLP